jgi:hypothetical protein
MKSFRQYIKESTVHDHIDDFVTYACNHLGIKNPPHINLVDDKTEAVKNTSFGGYNPNDKTIHVNVADRHPVDVMRTLAHELAHHRQDIDNRITHESGKTGSDIENEANAQAGIIMRNYGKMNSAIFESAEQGTLHVFDHDGVVVHPTAKVHVIDHHGKRVESLSHHEYNTHELKKGHKYDYSEFKSAEKNNEAHPIKKTIAKIKAIHKSIKNKPNHKIIINTARSDFDNKHKFLHSLSKYGLPMHDIHVHRAGNMEGKGSIAEKKSQIIRHHLKSGKYKEVHFYDDDHENLKHFNRMQHEFPHIKFHAHHVHHDGTTKKYTGE